MSWNTNEQLASAMRAALLMTPLVLLLSSCSSWLSIDEETVTKIESAPDKDLHGVAINRRHAYDVTLQPACTAAGGSGAACPAQFERGTQKLAGIDHKDLLLINARRMPFSSATLTIEVTGNQVAKKVGLDAKTGITGAPKTAKAILDAENDRKTIKIEAAEKEKLAKAEAEQE